MIRLLILSLALQGCAAQQTQWLTPAEQIWRDAYCGLSTIPPSDYDRILRWADEKDVRCTLEDMRVHRENVMKAAEVEQ